MRKTRTRLNFLIFSLLFIYSCSGGSNSSSSEIVESTVFPEHPFIWEVVSPSSVNMNEIKLNTAFNYAFADGTFTQSAIVIKDGKLVHERYRGILEGEINTIASSTTLDAATLQFLLVTEINKAFLLPGRALSRLQAFLLVLLRHKD